MAEDTASGGPEDLNIISKIGLLLRNVGHGLSGAGGASPVASAQDAALKQQLAQQKQAIDQINATRELSTQFSSLVKDTELPSERAALGNVYLPQFAKLMGPTRAKDFVDALVKQGDKAVAASTSTALMYKLNAYKKLQAEVLKDLPPEVKSRWGQSLQAQYPADPETGLTSMPLDVLLGDMQTIEDDNPLAILRPNPDELALAQDPAWQDRIATAIGLTPPSVLKKGTETAVTEAAKQPFEIDKEKRAAEQKRIEEDAAAKREQEKMRLQSQLDTEKSLATQVDTYYDNVTKRNVDIPKGLAIKHPDRYEPLVPTRTTTTEFPTANGGTVSTTITDATKIPASKIEGGGAGQTTKLKVGKALPQAAQESLIAAGDLRNKLQTITGVQDVAGPWTGWAKRALVRFAADKDATKFNTAVSSIRLALQSIVKGNPSNMDQTIIDAIAPQITEDPKVVGEKVDQLFETARNMVSMTLSFYNGAGYQIPVSVWQTAKDLGVDIDAVDVFDRKEGESNSQYVKRFEQETEKRVWGGMSDDTLLSITDPKNIGTIETNTLVRAKEELRRRIKERKGK